MKKIEAVILRERLEAVLGELERHGVRSGLTLIEVRHRENHPQGEDQGERNLLAFEAKRIDEFLPDS
jgi:nitrogen regulatory protein PII